MGESERGLEWEKLFRQAKRAAKRYVDDDHLAEDVAQDVMAKLFEHRSRDPFADRFVRAAARTRAIDVIRQRDAQLRLAAEHPNRRQRQQYGLSAPYAIEDLISSLRPIYREVFDLHLAGLLDTEVAEQLGISHGAVRTRLSEARKELRRLIAAADKD